MATCPACINATLDYLREEEDIFSPPPGTNKRPALITVDVYRCPACGHVERVKKAPQESPRLWVVILVTVSLLVVFALMFGVSELIALSLALGIGLLIGLVGRLIHAT